MIARTISLIIVAVALQGCVIKVNTDWENGDWESRQERNAEVIENLVMGVTESSVRSKLGDPDFTDAFLREDKTYVVLYYRSRNNKQDGVTTRDETTPLVFVEGGLVGWGDSAVEHATR